MLAERAGVSHPTVSRALRNNPRISAATRDRIQALAREMGYRPDPAMSALIAHRNRSPETREYRKIAVLNAWGSRLPFYMGTQLAGIRSRAAELGYEVELFPVTPDTAGHRSLSRVLVSRGIRGVIAGGLPSGFPPLAMTWASFSAVALGYSVQPVALHLVAADHMAAVDIAYRRLRAAGYRRIGFFDRLGSETRNQHLYLSSYLRCLVVDGIRYDDSPPLLFNNIAEVDPVPWLREHRFDAVVAGYHVLLIEQLQAAGLRVPEDVAVAAVSLRPEDQGMAGVRDAFPEMGAWAVDLLHGMLLTGKYGLPDQEYSVHVKGRWRDGWTAREVI